MRHIPNEPQEVYPPLRLGPSELTIAGSWEVPARTMIVNSRLILSNGASVRAGTDVQFIGCYITLGLGAAINGGTMTSCVTVAVKGDDE